jgi:2-methylcitrate dehydratase PrpD
LFHGFANTQSGDFEAMLKGVGSQWIWTTIAFKPYACGTMAHPYIDCARALRSAGVVPEDIAAIECDTAEGIVHRLWEPLAAKAAPPNAYAAKFSIPYAIAVALLRDNAGLSEYTDALAQDPALRALAGKVRYRIDPANPYPKQFTGHLRVTMKDGAVHEHRQAFFKGGAANPLSDDDMLFKFHANCAHGGLPRARAEALAAALHGIFNRSSIDSDTLTP